jgi:hypothetical protein
VGVLQSNVRYFPLRFPFLRVMGVNNVDASLIKNFRISEGGKRFQFKAEFLNAFNRTAVAGSEHRSAERAVRPDKCEHAGELPAAHSADGQVHFLMKFDCGADWQSARRLSTGALAG